MDLLGLFAILAGSLTAFAWAPLHSPGLLLTGYAVFTALVMRSRSTAGAAVIGLLFAAALHGTGQHWLLTSTLQLLHAGSALSLAIGAAYLLYLGLFTAIPAGIYARYFLDKTPRVHHALAWAALLSLGECARGLGLNGTSLLSVGYAFVDQWPAHWLPLLGLHGGSFLALCVASLAGHCLALPHESRSLNTQMTVGLAVAALLFWVGGLALRSVPWVRAEGTPISFRLLQGGIPQQDRFEATAMTSQVERYTSMIEQAGADLIATPETSIALSPPELPTGAWQRWRTFSHATGSHLFVGLPSIGPDGGGYNSIFHLSPAGGPPTRYDKIRLMPVGEYRPWGLGWLVDRVPLPLQDQTAGAIDQQATPLPHAGGIARVAMMVCLEDQSGQGMRDPVRLESTAEAAGLARQWGLLKEHCQQMGRPITLPDPGNLREYWLEVENVYYTENRLTHHRNVRSLHISSDCQTVEHVEKENITVWGLDRTCSLNVPRRTAKGACTDDGFPPKGNRTYKDPYAPRPDNIQTDTRNSNDIAEIRNLRNRTGTVDMQSYMSWLRQHGYVFAGTGEY